MYTPEAATILESVWELLKLVGLVQVAAKGRLASAVVMVSARRIGCR